VFYRFKYSCVEIILLAHLSSRPKPPASLILRSYRPSGQGLTRNRLPPKQVHSLSYEEVKFHHRIYCNLRSVEDRRTGISDSLARSNRGTSNVYTLKMIETKVNEIFRFIVVIDVKPTILDLSDNLNGRTYF